MQSPVSRSAQNPGIRFNFQPRNYDTTVNRASSGGRDSMFKNSKSLKLAPGANQLRLLPPTFAQAAGKEHYGLDLYVHYNVGPNGDAFLCPAKHNQADRRCPICERIPSATSDQEAKDLKPKHRVGAYFIHRAHEDEGPVLWPMPWQTDQDILNASTDAVSKAVFNPDDPVGGYDFVINKTGTGITTKYQINMARTPSPLSVDATKANAWLDYAVKHPLPDILDVKSYDYIAAAIGIGPVNPPRQEAQAPAAASAPAEQGAGVPAYKTPATEAELRLMGLDQQAALALGLGLDLEQIPDENALMEALIGRLGFATAAEEPVAEAPVSSFQARLAALKTKK